MVVVDILETPRIMRAKLEPKSNFHAAIMSHHRLWLWYVVGGCCYFLMLLLLLLKLRVVISTDWITLKDRLLFQYFSWILLCVPKYDIY